MQTLTLDMQAPKPTVTLEAAMKLYKLTAFELLWERETDTKAMIAWSEDTVVLAFRGTASLRNVLADLQARLGETVHAGAIRSSALIARCQNHENSG